MSQIDLGFSEICDSNELQSPYFPCKIGAKPAWLAYDGLPTREELQCVGCNQQMIFLLQIYAPFEDLEDNFHRTVFVFMCKTIDCSIRNSNNNVKVFRNNLPRKNDFYSFEPPNDLKEINFHSNNVKLCALCGCFADKNCSKCGDTFYCCREHQVMHWKETHKSNCGKSAVIENSQLLFKESEIAIEPEELKNANKQIDAAKELENFTQLALENKTGTMAEIADEEMNQYDSVDEDKSFSQFLKRISENPDQILRYKRGGEPLWIANKPKPDPIPPCEYCKSSRQFEFQIMPQILTVLQENELDFGVLAVYTCQKSCSDAIAYKNEFIYRQDVTHNQ